MSGLYNLKFKMWNNKLCNYCLYYIIIFFIVPCWCMVFR